MALQPCTRCLQVGVKSLNLKKDQTQISKVMKSCLKVNGGPINMGCL